jgi:hypothetical protein
LLLIAVVDYQYNILFKHKTLQTRGKIQFMEELEQSTFAMTDVNLKFNKPEINVDH